MIVGELQDVVASTATRRPIVPLGHTGQTVRMTAEDQIAVSGALHGGAILSVHHRGATVSGPGFVLLIDGTEGTLEITSTSGYPHLEPVTVRGARGRAPLSRLTLPDGHDDYSHLGMGRGRSGTVANWLAENDMPAARVHDVAQPISISGYPTTFWRYIKGRNGGFGAAGATTPSTTAAATPTRMNACEIDTLTVSPLKRRPHDSAQPHSAQIETPGTRGKVQSTVDFPTPGWGPGGRPAPGSARRTCPTAP